MPVPNVNIENGQRDREELSDSHFKLKNHINQGSATPEPWLNTSRWPVRNQAIKQEVSSKPVSEATSAIPHHLHYHLNYSPAPTLIRGKMVFQETGP